VPSACDLAYLFGFGKDPISQIWKSLAHISRHFSLAFRSTHLGERRYHVFYRLFILKIMQIYFPKKKRKKGWTSLFADIWIFFALVGIRNGILKLELHQFQNKRLRTANTNNGW